MLKGTKAAFVMGLGLSCGLMAAQGAGIRYVDVDATGAGTGNSWNDAFTSVQPALTAAQSGDQVWVAAGTYVENITLNAGVALYGGFAGNENPATFNLADRDFAANETILDGNQASSVVTAPAGATEATRIDGFTIRNGKGIYGGGISLTDSSPTIAHNVIIDNISYGGEISGYDEEGRGCGGGIYSSGGNPVITDNVIKDNLAEGYLREECWEDPYSGEICDWVEEQGSGGGIYCKFSDPTIKNNTITGNIAFYEGGGIHCGYNSSPTIANNTVTDNRSNIGGSGIHCFSSSPMITNNRIKGNCGSGVGCSDFSSPMIANNTITGNSGDGIRCSSSSPTITTNTITKNSACGIEGSTSMISNTIVAFNSSGIHGTSTLRNNCVYGNTSYNYSGVTDPTGSNGNISADPKLVGVAYGNVHIQPDSPCVDTGNNSDVFGEYDMDGQSRIQPTGGTVDIGADESDGTVWPEGPYTIIRVSPNGDDAHDGSSWALAKRTVQAGVDAAAALGGEVWVKAGTYNERITLHPYAYLYGGFAGTENSRDERDWLTHTTILDGQQAGSVVTARAGHQISRLDGFTIRNGSGTRSKLTNYERWGGGIFCYNSSPTIANNTITENSALHSGSYGRGGGIFCEFRSSPTIANNTITENNASTYGGGIYNGSLCSPTIAKNTIMGNGASYGGGILCYYNTTSSSTIANNIISGNSATESNGRGGGIGCYYSSPIIANNTIMGNSSRFYGGGIYCDNSSPAIANNTITGNKDAANRGGGICCYSSSPTITNTIVAFNTSGIYKTGTGTPTLRYNCVYGNTAHNYSGVTNPTGSNGNISADPKLSDTAYGNIHIQPDSPCIEAGDDMVVQPDWLDADGQTRMQNSHVDIGADESDGTVWTEGPYAIVRVAPNGDDANNGSSWALAKRTVQSGIDLASTLGGEVWVQAGIYNERIALHPYAYLYGGFAGTESTRDERDWTSNPTILDGQQGGSVVSVRAGHQVSRIDGFIIRNGNGNVPLNGIYNRGGGICCECSSTIIVNNTIKGNCAYYDGGGIFCNYSSSIIANNTITECSIISSEHDGRGGGIFCISSSLMTIINNKITGNIATSSGGGISCYASSPTIANNTITGNIASSSGGGIYCEFSSSPTITNTIITFNSSGVYKTGTGTPTLRYSCVYGNAAYNYSGVTDPTGTNGNISADPRFVQADPGADNIWGTADDSFNDLRLLADSPCIDAGDNAAVPADVVDLDGDGNTTEPLPFDLAGVLRFLDNPNTTNTGSGTPPILDMGAYEYLTPIAADFNNDGDVDQVDFAVFQSCASGPALPHNGSETCQKADFDDDGDVDQEDFGVLQRCYSGEGNPADPGCG